MNAPNTRRELLSVDAYAALTGLSPTEIRRQIRAGKLPAETFERPQGTYYRVIVDAPEDPPSTSQEAPGAHQDVSEALRILEERLAFADTLIRANGDSLAQQAEQIDGLHRELRDETAQRATAEGRAALLAELLDAERARAADLAETTQAQSRQIAAQAESIADLAARLQARRWWKWW